MADPIDPNSPEELARQNAMYGVNGTAMNKPSATSVWDPTQGTWSDPATTGSGREGYDRAAAYFKSKNTTPFATSLDTWNDYWNDWGKNDPAYFDQRLSQADEFTGVGPNYDWQAAGKADPGQSAAATAASQATAVAPGAYVPPTINTASPTNTAASDALVKMLMDRAQQGLDVNANDPVIKGQVDAFDAAQQRAGRRYLAGAAEAAGPNANIGAETRLQAENEGQATSAFQATQIGQEVSARRTEIQQALAGLTGYLTAQQQMSLQQELAQLDHAQQLWEFQQSQSQSQDQFTKNLMQRAYEYDTTDQFRNSPLGS